MKSSVVILLTVLLFGCTSAPKGITPVEDFQLSRYLGTWYEIARQNHSFEKGLSQVSATYTLQEDGGVAVLNRGYSEEEQAWKEADGRAYFVESANIGHLKVSFFGPFYGAYVIFELDKQDYQYAMVSGPNRKFFWLLSRTPQMPKEVIDELLAKAAALGFPVDELIIVDQSKKTSM
ncbi:lipocalin family protein [Marinomonas algarum]|uniref:Outer membrane lipoprotein Blc n=1 Tax=Marinomonas algarum TaxID=2883105 RepID=A0A9X1LF27_9GAMM|nr:lipocalin family protein [Marinomonas algarum]MCB5162235.1 lipocalin family protein [Marinomonas algarum]